MGIQLNGETFKDIKCKGFSVQWLNFNNKERTKESFLHLCTSTLFFITSSIFFV